MFLFMLSLGNYTPGSAENDKLWELCGLQLKVNRVVNGQWINSSGW